MHYFGTDYSSVITGKAFTATWVMLALINIIAAVKEASPINPAYAESDVGFPDCFAAAKRWNDEDKCLILIHAGIFANKYPPGGKNNRETGRNRKIFGPGILFIFWTLWCCSGQIDLLF